MELTDKELVHQIQFENNPIAFSRLVERHQPKVLRICLGFVSQRADAEDLAQEVFIEVLRSLGSFRGDSQFATWLYRIAVNKSINFVRKKKREQLFQRFDVLLRKKGEEPMELPDDGHFAADRDIRTREARILLKKALSSLPKNQRTAFILAKYQDLSYREIAEVMELSISAVESLLFRAKANLQRFILEKNKPASASFSKLTRQTFKRTDHELQRF